MPIIKCANMGGDRMIAIRRRKRRRRRLCRCCSPSVPVEQCRLHPLYLRRGTTLDAECRPPEGGENVTREASCVVASGAMAIFNKDRFCILERHFLRQRALFFVRLSFTSERGRSHNAAAAASNAGRRSAVRSPPRDRRALCPRRRRHRLSCDDGGGGVAVQATTRYLFCDRDAAVGNLFAAVSI